MRIINNRFLGLEKGNTFSLNNLYLYDYFERIVRYLATICNSVIYQDDSHFFKIGFAFLFTFGIGVHISTTPSPARSALPLKTFTLPNVPATIDTLCLTTENSWFMADYVVKETSYKVSSCVIPQVTAFAIQPSCTNDIPNNDGYLQLSAVDTATHYNWSVGNTYTGATTIVSATVFNSATDLPLQFGTIANPTGSQDYTIRVFNGASDCYTDVLVTMNEQNCTVGCACTENIYLNETTGGGNIHKFEIPVGGGSLVNHEIGSPWFDNTAAGETVTAPHGLGTDLNGRLYIGESDQGDIRQFTCDGDITPATDFEISIDGIWNIGSIGNTLYTNARWYDGKPDGIYAFDLCTGDILGYLCLNELAGNTSDHYRDWGFYIDANGYAYVTDSYYDHWSTVEDNNLWVINLHTAPLNDPASTSPVCIDPMLSSDDGVINIGDSELPTKDIWGVTTDTSGNIYIVEDQDTTRIHKYSPTGVLLATSLYDHISGLTFPGTNPATGLPYTSNDRGFREGRGIVYSPISNQIYVSTQSPIDDCISLFDTDLNYLGAAVPYTDNTTAAKGMSLLRECCPTNNTITLDTILCHATAGDMLFLQEFINCSGTICEGTWQEGGSNTGLTYNSCDNSIIIDTLEACGSFTLKSDGIGNNPQCGAFKITVNITVAFLDVNVTQTSCTHNTDGTFTANYDALVDWSSVPCTVGELINVSHNGTAIGTIDPSTASSPGVLSFSLPADGSGTNIVKATFTNASCADSLTFKTPLPCPTDVPSCSSNAGCLGGNAFEDFNCNGTDNTNEPGVQGVQVVVYDCQNNAVDTVWTDSDGDWQVCGLTDGDAYRVEFILPESIACWANPTHVGSDNGTDVQFLTAPACTHFSLSSSADYCQENPSVYLPCFTNGEAGAGGTADDTDAFVSFPYQSNGETGSAGYTGSPTHLADFEEIGANWGVGYDRVGGRLFTSAVYRRHSGFGPLGTGGIYMLDVNATSPSFSNYIDLATLGINTGMDTRTPYDGLPLSANELPDDTNEESWDVGAFDRAGRSALGDIEVSADGTRLYIANIENTSIVTLDISGPTPTLISETIVPAPASCPASDFYIWGLTIEKGELYIGGVCSAETSNNVNDLNGHIIKYNSSTFQSVAQIPFDYSRRDNAGGTNGGGNSDWKPWTSTFQTQGTGSFAVWPQPIISDIEIEADGSIIVAVLDRNGLQIGSQNYGIDINSTTRYQGITSSDILKICNGVLESNGTCGGITTIGAGDGDGYSDGTDNGEFYWGDQYDYNNWTNPHTSYATHTEIGFGSLLLLKGLNEVMMTSYNPTQTANSGGVIILDNTTGGRNSYYSGTSGTDYGYRLYTTVSGDPTSFGKSSGLGDLEAGCDPAPLEIGNYVWCDSVANGIQDACERGIDSMLVQLYDENGRLVGQDTTLNGNYYFNQYNVDTTGITVDGNGVASANMAWSGMDYNTKYYIVFGNNQYNNGTGEFMVGTATYYGVTTADVNSNGNDNVDSDVDGSTLSTSIGVMPANLPVICMTTEAVGCGNHQYDMGVLCTFPCPTIDSLMADRVICPDDVVDTLAVTTTLENPDSIAFVYFTSPQTDSSLIYANGTGIDTVQITSNNDTVRIFNVNGFTNTGTTPITFYIYGIAHPTPASTTCRPYEEILVTVQPDPTATVEDVLKCTTNSETIAVSPSGGTAPYTYSWSGPFITDPGNVYSFTATSSGTYTVTVTDADGCTTTASGEMTFQSKACLPATFKIRRRQGN